MGIKTSHSISENSDQRKYIGEYLEELEEAREKLKTGEIGVEEAKQSLQGISEITTKIMVNKK